MQTKTEFLITDTQRQRDKIKHMYSYYLYLINMLCLHFQQWI